jgi:hypothetical protein
MDETDGALSDLARQLTEAVGTANEAQEAALLAAVRVGQLLHQVKTQLRHKHWAAWLKENCGLTEQAASRYAAVLHKWERG